MISTLALQNFRNYTKRTFEFSSPCTVIVAPNAAGKTNILEAIIFLATGKSFRADVDRECISFGAEIARVKTTIHDVSLECVLTFGSVGGKAAPLKKYIVNGVPRRQIDFVGHVHAVLFWPEHLELVTDSPSIRRKYLDSVLVQVDREYHRSLLSYERALRQRNKLLDAISEGRASRNQLLFWNQLLIAAGGYLTDKRAEYIAFVNDYRIPNMEYRIEYDKSIISQPRLEQYKDEEVAAKATLVGPHRDDMRFFVQQKEFHDLSKFGSRGQQRLAILWLKLAELSYIEKMSGTRPILLLDDIFSELDQQHRQLVFAVIAKQQTIITTADQIDLKGKQWNNIFTIQL